MQTRYRIMMAVGVIAAVGVLSAIAIAQTADTVYYGCLSDNGKLSNVSVDIEPTCKGNDTLIQWNASGPEGPPGPAGESLFNPVSETVFSITSADCPAGAWRLQVASQSGVAVPWDTSECDDIRVQGAPSPSLVELNAYADLNTFTGLDGTSFIDEVLGKITNLDDGMWRMNCLLQVAGEGPNSSFPSGPGNVKVNCAVFVGNGEETRLAEVLDSGELESQSIVFFE